MSQICECMTNIHDISLIKLMIEGKEIKKKVIEWKNIYSAKRQKEMPRKHTGWDIGGVYAKKPARYF